MKDSAFGTVAASKSAVAERGRLRFAHSAAVKASRRSLQDNDQGVNDSDDPESEDGQDHI